MRRLLPVVGLVAIACSVDPTGPGVDPKGPSLAIGSNQEESHIVVYQPNTVGADALTTSLEQRHGLRNISYRYERAIQGFAAKLTAGQVRQLRADPRVLSVELDGIMATTATQNNPPSWGLDRIDQVNLPLSLSYTYPVDGTGVSFYSIDTGVLFTHSDFGGRAQTGFDAITAGGTAADCNGHGTHTSSTAAGTVYGVAKKMSIYAVRVLGCNGSGTTSGVIAGVDWVRINARKPAVANMSLGGGLSSALNSAVANAVAAGIVFTVSAGNSNADACGASPASTPSALTVGATTQTDNRSSFSNFGSCLDLFAPGSGITAAVWPSGTAVFSGTSMSAPHVAGVAGLYLQLNPTATPAQVATAIVNGAATGKVIGPGTNSPNRLLNIGFLGGAPVNQPPVASFTFNCTGLSCNFNGTGSTDDNGVTGYSWNFGDGTTGTGATVTKTYGAAGTYSVTLTVRDAGNLTNATTKSVTVSTPPANQPPVASFTFSCSALACSFNGSGSTDDVGVTGYSWAFGDGTTGTGVTVNKTFAAPGTYLVTLTVSDAGGLTNATSKSVTVTSGSVNQPPVAVARVSCGGTTICTFDATGSTDDQGITVYMWLDAQNRLISGKPIHKLTFFALGNTYTWSLSVRDAQGLTTNTKYTFTVGQP